MEDCQKLREIRHCKNQPRCSCVDDEDRCCAYDAVWKMLMFHPVFKDIQVATDMKREKMSELKQFQDLNIMKPSKTNDRKNLHQIYAEARI